MRGTDRSVRGVHGESMAFDASLLVVGDVSGAGPTGATAIGGGSLPYSERSHRRTSSSCSSRSASRLPALLPPTLGPDSQSWDQSHCDLPRSAVDSLREGAALSPSSRVMLLVASNIDTILVAVRVQVLVFGTCSSIVQSSRSLRAFSVVFAAAVRLGRSG